MKTIWILGGLAGTIEGEGWRDYRENQFGKYLSSKGYNVIWWTSNFSHHFKKYRSTGWKDIKINDNYTIRLVPTTSYKKNFSIKRFWAILTFSLNAGKGFNQEERPDLITGNCTMSFGYPMMQYSMKHNIPYIVDTGDVWPEFIEKNMASLKKLSHVLFQPIYRRRVKLYSNAAGLTALGKNYLSFAKKVAPNGKEKISELIYNGPDLDKFRVLKKEDLTVELKGKINAQPHDILCIFAGTLGPSYDIDAILKCAQSFNNENKPVKFIIAGSGPRREDVEEAAKHCDNIIYVGVLSPNDLIPLYKNCHIGLCAYTSKSNVDMPDKFYDYTAAGLAIVNSLTEEAADYVREYQVGMNYTASNDQEMHDAIEQIVEGKLEFMRENSEKLSYQFDAKVQNEKLGELVSKLSRLNCEEVQYDYC